jgi:hypothetical protein
LTIIDLRILIHPSTIVNLQSSIKNFALYLPINGLLLILQR